ncbi:MAG: hypothetical protein KDD64_09940 [Bdellovibrionales bacterium]|nr:hypothetical protein [Bdellovibrionales bacterium]
MTSFQSSKLERRLPPPPTSHSPSVLVEGEVAASFIVALCAGHVVVAFHDSHSQAISACFRKDQHADIVGDGIRALKGEEEVELLLYSLAFSVTPKQIRNLLQEGFPGKNISIRS